MICLKKHRPDLKRSTLKRELSRLAERGLINRIERGKYGYIPPSSVDFVKPTEVYRISKEVQKLINKTLGHNLNTLENQKLIYQTMQNLISDLLYQSRKNPSS